MAENEDLKIGVYVCECGINIGSTVDVEKVAEHAQSLPNVVVSRFYKYMCSEPGQALIKKDIEELGLDRVIVASCSPRMHEPTFQAVVEEAGMNPYCFEMANIREHCSWAHMHEPEKATEKAKDLVRMAVAKARLIQPLEKKEVPVVERALVIGGGIAGIQAALEIANNGFKAHLVEKSPSIGGRMSQLDKTFPTLDCSACILTPKMVDVGRHPNIDLMTYSEVEGIEGSIGNFKVKVKKKSRYIDEEKCTGCGECAQRCPVTVPNEFDMDLRSRKACYVPFPQAVPLKFTIDKREGIPPCKATCPAGVNVQGYVALISEGKFEEALALEKEKNPLPGICGRICHHPCETECNRREIDEPIAICTLKRFIADYELENKSEVALPPIEGKKEQKVAIVGSGPAGLTAAYRLAIKGYDVTIFEALPVTGGMLSVGIPEFRLPRDIVQKEVESIKALGVEIKTNTAIGEDLSLDDLFNQGYKAIFLGIGAHKSLKLNLEGEELEGVYHGVDFLRDVNLGKEIDLKGKKVVVIGGGNVAIDSVRTAARLGAEAFILYRRSREEMPANSWDIEEAEEEGIKIHFLAAPIKIRGENGKVVGLECNKMELGEPDETGRRRPVPVEGSEFTLDMDMVIPAISQVPDISFIPPDSNLNLTRWKTIVINPKTMMTNLKGIFAGGDFVSGPASAIEAIAHGNKVADSIDRYLQGAEMAIEPPPEPPIICYEDLDLEPDIEKIPRNKIPMLEPSTRVTHFKEVASGFSEVDAIEEANRCLNCAICCECGECLKACEELKAIDHNMEDETKELNVGTIVVATGYDMFDPTKKPEYGYGKYENVITGLEFERLCSSSGPTGGKIQINDKEPEKVVFIQCVGSRDRQGNQYCSRVCCMYTAKHAHLVRERVPNTDVTIFYTDVRAFGKGFEEFYNRVKDEGVIYIKRELVDDIEVTKNNGGLVVKTEGNPDIEADLVVLATAIVPRNDIEDIAKVLKLPQSADGFFLEAHPKLKPVDSVTRGIYLAGCCQSPKDISDAVAQASGAAVKALIPLSQGKVDLEPTISFVVDENCDGCAYCVDPCPFNAITLIEYMKEGNVKKTVQVNEALCQGCGVCQATCPKKGIIVRGFTLDQFNAMIEAMMEVS